MLLVLGVSRYFGIDQAALLAVPIMISLPAALLSAKVEYWQRRMQASGYNRIIRWGRKGEESDAAGRVILLSLFQILALHVVFLCACLLVLIGTIWAMSWYLGHLPVINGVTWLHLWFVAGIGGIMSLRVRRSYVLFLAILASATLLLSL